MDNCLKFYLVKSFWVLLTSNKL